MSKDETKVLKAAAIILIIISHIMGMYGIRYFTPLGGIGVAIFLFCSGYGLTESYKSKGLEHFWKNRIATVMIPYILVEMCAVMLLDNYSGKEFLYSTLLIDMRRTEIWYLRYLMLNYVSFWLVHRFLKGRIRLVLLALLGLISLLYMPEIKAEQAFSFFCGCLFSYNTKLFVWLKKHMWILFSLGCVALAIKQIEVVRESPQVVMNLIQLLIKLPIGLFVIGMIKRIDKLLNFRFLKFVGETSYELYLVHINFLDIIVINPFGVVIFVLLTVILATGLTFIDRYLIKSCVKVRKTGLDE